MFSRSRRPRLLGAAGGLVIVAVAVFLLSSGSSSAAAYYLALGDSLSVGIQPTATGAGVVTQQGYVDDLYSELATHITGLKLVQMGCPGDTTANVLTGQGNAVAAREYHCDRHGGSQLQAALDFIHAHRRRLKVISIDIGANDVNQCINPALVQQGMGELISCINQGEQAVAVNSPRILDALRAAAAPGTVLIAGDYYDPYLAYRLSHNAQIDSVVDQSLRMITRVNAEIAYADAAAGFRTADVAGVFSVYDTAKVTEPSGGSRLPRDVAVVCADTWMCAKAPRGPNVHPNAAGYRMIARAFEAVLPRAL